MKNRSLTTLSLVAAATCLANFAAAVEIERPKVQAVDALGVDITTGQVTHSVTPVSIGGALGLAYQISVYANEANWGGDQGFMTSYSGMAKPIYLSNDTFYSPRYIMRVNDDGGSADFKVVVNGVVQNEIINLPPPYTYVALGDSRHSLVVNGSYLDWTKPDGTLVRFGRGSGVNAGAMGLMVKSVAPNGFTIEMSAAGYTTNTGYQLKPITEPDHRPMGKPDNPNLIGVPPASTSAGSGWSSRNPKYVKALNNAYEYCAPAPAPCNPSLSWPTATIEWPAGMPRTLFIGDSIVRVTDAAGGITNLRYRAYDLAYNAQGQVVQGYTPGREFSPRLLGIKPPSASQETFTYDYTNLFSLNSSPWGGWNARAQTSGVVRTANHIGKQGNYSMMNPTIGGQNYLNVGSGDGGVQYVHTIPKAIPGKPDLIEYVTTEEGRVNFDVSSARNFPVSFLKATGPMESYQYDARGNLERIQYSGGSLVTFIQAHYPASCTPATIKICNQADWIADARGNVTNYTYHAESGQLASVTLPPDADNRRAQTRYEYTQKSALYFNGGSTKVSGPPIWMKTAERYCIDSNFSSGACASGDEVVTRFEYNNDNLLMTGMTVTAPGGATLRTCYQYDRLGNQVGKTEPNANLGSCN